MPYKLAYFKEARQDIRDAKEWYYDQLKGLEKRFSDDVKIAITRLKTNPYAHAVRYKKIRIAHPDIFPYSIHYYIDEELTRIVIIGIIHNSRDSGFLNRRK
ncbi:MAG: plasmid stabilization system [Flavipsychrobacter sp.]|jgi:plasmid stabilization system protein ParE|nr:plasmid stabilization system [Flavipsychrobacter sp.]